MSDEDQDDLAKWQAKFEITRGPRRSSPMYSADQIDMVIKAAGGLKRTTNRGRFWEALEDAASWYFTMRLPAAPSKVRDQARKFEKGATRLISLVGDLDRGNDRVSASLRYRIESEVAELEQFDPTDHATQWLADLTERLATLQTVAKNVAEKAHRETESRRADKASRREPDHLRRILVWRLAVIYRGYIIPPKGMNRSAPGYSVAPTGGEPYGPFIRYLDGCLRPLGVALKPAGLAALWDVVKASRRLRGSR